MRTGYAFIWRSPLLPLEHGGNREVAGRCLLRRGIDSPFASRPFGQLKCEPSVQRVLRQRWLSRRRRAIADFWRDNDESRTFGSLRLIIPSPVMRQGHLAFPWIITALARWMTARHTHRK